MTELFRTSAFRLALFYFGLFAVSVLAVLTLIYWQTVIYADRQMDEAIDAEVTGLAEQYRQGGLAGLIGVIQERSNPARGGTMLYLLIDADGRPLAGNLDTWPNGTVAPDGWLRFDLKAPDKRPHAVRATSFLLARNYQLLVGRDLAERAAFQRRIITALGWSAGLTLMLGLGGGLVMSRRVLSRLEAINRASDQVMAGQLDQRIPLNGTNDEFDRLAGNLNAMLDRIEKLMAGMRQVSDNIAHDLRSPLGRLRTRLEMVLRQDSEAPVEYRRAIEVAIGDADQLLATFAALLDIAEAEAGSINAEMARLDIVTVIRALLDFFEPVADEQGVRLDAQLPPDPIEVHGNRHLLSRALANLIGNALKYAPGPGTVTIAVERRGDSAAIVVSDTGPGIPEEARDRVFDRFVRLDQSRTTEGNGLGLSLVRAIIRLHGGDVILEDAVPGLRAVVMLPSAGPKRLLRPRPAETTIEHGDYTTVLDNSFLGL